jgi:group I intron endonuclease
MRKAYIYKLIDPRCSSVRYVGKSVQPKRRLNDHISQSKNLKYYCSNWIKSLLAEGLKPIMEIIEECTEDNWKERELFWIEEYEKTCKLTNTAIGGMGGQKKGHTLGRKLTEEQRAKFSKARIGLKKAPHTEETKEKFKKARLEYLKKNVYVPIYQYNLDGTFIKKWESNTEAADFYGVNRVSIIVACKKENLTCIGFLWDYEYKEKKPYEKILIDKRRRNKVNQYDMNGNYLNTYTTIREAAKEIGIKYQSISACLRGLSKNSGGYLWKFEE